MPTSWKFAAPRQTDLKKENIRLWNRKAGSIIEIGFVSKTFTGLILAPSVAERR
jgi:hypothetical protein